MQLTINIPDTLYHQLEHLAAVTHRSVEEAILDQAIASLGAPEISVREVKRRRVSLPIIPAGEPGTMDLTQNLNDALFDDFDPS